MVNGKAANLINEAANFSYSLNITVFRWGRIERMFTSPVSYFKSLYPVDTLEDAKNLIDKILGIARLFNPDIPDFRSIRNLLESLLKSLADKMMSLAGEAQKEFWAAVKPLMVTIRKVLDLLKELYDHLVKEATELLKSIQDKLFDGLEEGKSFLNDIAKDHGSRSRTIGHGSEEHGGNAVQGLGGRRLFQPVWLLLAYAVERTSGNGAGPAPVRVRG